MAKRKFKSESEAINYLRDAGYAVDEEGKTWRRASWAAYIDFRHGWYYVETM